MGDRLGSERIVVEAPTSYAGSAKRLWRLTWLGPSWAKVATVPLVLVLIGLAWVLVTGWYLVTVLLLGVLLLPWRFLRRSQRKERAARARHRELLGRQQ